jgi:hypothetical protein
LSDDSTGRREHATVARDGDRANVIGGQAVRGGEEFADQLAKGTGR